ncbi:MAG: carbohydrate binding family 9 domain-containing protein [Candidatus Marinimicrobia bacterium]|nr:carbohydrate binding family 9 domain-containing protein [Candidatus Neomarinimicrobiota bacterium]
MKALKILVLIFIIFTVTLGKSKGLAYLSAIDEKVITAVRKNAGSIHIDGNISEEIWKSAPEGNGFIQRNPDEGKPATEPTKFRVLYDNRNLYVCVHAIDSEPEKIKGILTRKDQYSPSDWIKISIDSYNDNRTAFEFGLNPLGVKCDLLRFDDVNEDDSWDPIWYGAAHIDSTGWMAEFKIPLKELRFSEGKNQIWGFQIYRHISRKNEDLYWTYWPKEESGWVSQYGKIQGISSVPRQKRIYVTPYTNGFSTISKNLVNDVHPEKYDLSSKLGADIKYGITNNLTFDLALNPDFGQVEADPGDLNLTAFETYFPEKRPFFIEGRNIFNFNLGIGDGDLSQNSLFYSRRIGRTPQRNLNWEVEDDTTWVNQPTMTTILGAGKITGKTENGWSIGILNALTKEEHGKFLYKSKSSNNELIEPLTNYSVARLQKDFRNGQTTLGGIFTSTLRNIKDEDLEFLRDCAITGGVDFSHLFWDRHYMIDAAFAFSNVHGSKEAIHLTQESSMRYFQRPDANHVSLDTNRTSLTGFSNKLAFGKIAGGNWRWVIGFMGSSPEFEINDLGYMRNVDQLIEFIWVAYREHEPGKIFRRYQINFNQWSAWNYEKIKLSTGGNFNGFAQFLNYWSVFSGANIQLPGISTGALRGGPSIKTTKGCNFWGGIDTDSRKIIHCGFHLNGSYDEDGSNRLSFSPFISFRPTESVKLLLSPNFNKTFDWWSWVECIEDNNYQNHYIFAELTQKLISMTIRLDYTLTPNLSIQFYGEPFLTAGIYDNYKEVVDQYRLSDDYRKRFRNYESDELTYFEDDEDYGVDYNGDGDFDYFFGKCDFNFKQFKSNLVIRWEYLPGSILYLVWAQGFNHWTSNGQFNIRNDLENLFQSNPENVFMLKLSYLLDI